MKKINKKLQLNKETIAALNNDEQKVIYGGAPLTWVCSQGGYVTMTCHPKYTCKDQNTATCNPPTEYYYGTDCCPSNKVCPVVDTGGFNTGPQPQYTVYC